MGDYRVDLLRRRQTIGVWSRHRDRFASGEPRTLAGKEEMRSMPSRERQFKNLLTEYLQTCCSRH
jgi:hypothetical protein